MALLDVDGLEVTYGKIRAVKGVSFSVNAGTLVTLIGANGAGKTTTLRTLSGLVPPSAGTVTFDGQRLDGVPAHQIVERGVAHVPEGRRVFPRMTVAENLELGAFSRAGRAAGTAAEQRADMDRILSLFPVLAERRDQAAGTLSGGEQQMLAIGRALMSRPRLLMLDEPSLGLAPLIARQIFDAIRTLNRQDGLTVLIVEQNANHALKLAHRGYVMVNGLITLAGTGGELLQRPEIRAAYLEGGRRG